MFFSSENLEVNSNRIQNISDKLEESGPDDTIQKPVSLVTEKISDTYEKKKSEISASSSSSSSDSSTSDSDTDDSSGK